MVEFVALYRNMPVRVYNDTPASDVSVQFTEHKFGSGCHVTTCMSICAPEEMTANSTN